MRAPTRSVVLVVVAIFSTGAAGCGSSDEGGNTKPAPPATTTVSQQAMGLGFTVQVPPNWTDAEDQLNVGGVRYDVAAADSTAKGFKKNVTISRQSGQQLAGQTLETLDASARKSVEGPGVSVRSGAPVTLDGTPAKEAIIERRQGGRRLASRTVISLYKSELYAIQFVSEAGDGSAEGILRTMLATWRWTP